jgi:hypothetical protein
MAMVNILSARKLGVLARVVAQHATRTRTFSAVVKAGRTTAAHWARVLRQLWLEVTGFVFLALASIGAISFVRELAKYRAGQATGGRVVVATIFTLMFVWFGMSSFWRVRKKAQRGAN